MATLNIPVTGNPTLQVTKASDAASAGALAMFDTQGGLNGNTVTGTSLVSSSFVQTAIGHRTASFTAGANGTEFIDSTSGAVTVTLPSAAGFSGVEISFVKTDSSGNAVTLTGALGGSSLASQYNHARLKSDGTNWYNV